MLGALTQHVMCAGATQTRRPISLAFRSGRSASAAAGRANNAHMLGGHHLGVHLCSRNNLCRGMQHVTAQAEEYVNEGALSFDDIVVGEVYQATVVKIVSFGVFVNLSFKPDALVHISEIADCYVSDINDYVSLYEVLPVRIINKEPARMRLSASIKQSGVPLTPKYDQSPRGQHEREPQGQYEQEPRGQYEQLMDDNEEDNYDYPDFGTGME